MITIEAEKEAQEFLKQFGFNAREVLSLTGTLLVLIAYRSI